MFRGYPCFDKKDIETKIIKTLESVKKNNILETTTMLPSLDKVKTVLQRLETSLSLKSEAWKLFIHYYYTVNGKKYTTIVDPQKNERVNVLTETNQNFTLDVNSGFSVNVKVYHHQPVNEKEIPTMINKIDGIKYELKKIYSYPIDDPIFEFEVRQVWEGDSRFQVQNKMLTPNTAKIEISSICIAPEKYKEKKQMNNYNIVFLSTFLKLVDLVQTSVNNCSSKVGGILFHNNSFEIDFRS